MTRCSPSHETSRHRRLLHFPSFHWTKFQTNSEQRSNAAQTAFEHRLTSSCSTKEKTQVLTILDCFRKHFHSLMKPVASFRPFWPDSGEQHSDGGRKPSNKSESSRWYRAVGSFRLDGIRMPNPLLFHTDDVERERLHLHLKFAFGRREERLLRWRHVGRIVERIFVRTFS